MNITSAGEILIDFLPIEEDGQTAGFRMHPGGSPFNVAVGVARLGHPIAFAGKISTDFFGRYLRHYVEAQGIDTRFLLDSAALSTLAFVAKEDGEPAYSFYGEDTADTRLSVDEFPPEFFTDTRILHIGSISLLRGTTPQAIHAAAERLKGKALISLDPNIRPNLVHDEVKYRELLGALVELSDIVKISEVDLAWLAPGRPVEQVAADLLAQGSGLVVVTRGSRGALAARAAARTAVGGGGLKVAAGGIVYSPAPYFPVEVVDTVGAGDAFTAGLLAGMADHGVTSRAPLANLSADDLADVLRLASATAAITCARAGANPPTRAEVEEFLAAH